MKKKSKLIAIAFILSGLLSVAFLSRAFNSKVRQEPKKHHLSAVLPAGDDISYDPILLKRFTGLMKQIDFTANTCSVSGTINILDGKDSLNNVNGLRFTFRKQDSLVDYLIGNSEIINNGELNVLIDNDHRKVMVSGDHFSANSPLANLGELTGSLRSEHYALLEKTTGKSKKISVLNEQHITCKEVSLTYDTVSNQLQRIYTRMTDVTDPMNSSKERRLVITFNSKERQEGKAMRVVSDVIGNETGQPVLRQQYAAYELIML